ncbi:MAG: hypothetical protein OHK0022_00240 [Roseiflexaceae bacterium]
MSTLQICLFAEGVTDIRFLPSIIYRTSIAILSTHRRTDVDVDIPNIVIPESKKVRLADQIFSVARQSHMYDILAIHLDADYPTRDRALQERFQPGLDLILQGKKSGQFFPKILPIIPVHSIEAWMLADPEALLTALGTDLSPGDLGLPSSVHQIERNSNPKQIFNDAIRRSQSHRTKRKRHNNNIEYIHNYLSENIKIERLLQLSSFQNYYEDLTNILQELHLINPDS